jgi:hypothetical protein
VKFRTFSSLNLDLHHLRKFTCNTVDVRRIDERVLERFPKRRFLSKECDHPKRSIEDGFMINSYNKFKIVKMVTGTNVSYCSNIALSNKSVPDRTTKKIEQLLIDKFRKKHAAKAFYGSPELTTIKGIVRTFLDTRIGRDNKIVP